MSVWDYLIPNTKKSFLDASLKYHTHFCLVTGPFIPSPAFSHPLRQSMIKSPTHLCMSTHIPTHTHTHTHTLHVPPNAPSRCTLYSLWQADAIFSSRGEKSLLCSGVSPLSPAPHQPHHSRSHSQGPLHRPTPPTTQPETSVQSQCMWWAEGRWVTLGEGAERRLWDPLSLWFFLMVSSDHTGAF